MSPASEPSGSILDSLNPAQREAVTTTEGPLLVIAGAGSGKTRVITHRIAYLVRERGVHPWQVFAATFTNKAAAEMRARIGAMLPGFETARLTVATFHSICVGILRRECVRCGLTPKFTIADDSDQLALVKDCLRELDLPASRVKPEEARGWIGRAKTMMASPAQVQAAFSPSRPEPDEAALYSRDEILGQLASEVARDLARVYELYEARLARNNAVDFDDLIIKVVRLFRADPDALALYQERWTHYLVDEFQDTNRVQAELMRLLAGRDRNLCVVGDEDQSIYSWRGAEIENILNFPRDWPGARVVRLEENYRSTATILRAADAVIRRNTQRHGKTLRSVRGDGPPIVQIVGGDDRGEAAEVVATIRRLARQRSVPLRDIAVFYRVNALSRLYEDFLREANLPYRVVGGVRFYDRAEIKDLLAYLRLVDNPVDGVSLTRIINKPRRGVGDKTLTKIFSDASKRGVSIYEQLGEAVTDAEIPRKARAGLADLLHGLARWRKLAESRRPAEILDAILKDTAFVDSLGDVDKMETLSRQENIAEFRRAVDDYGQANPDSGLDRYLEAVALTQSHDEQDEDEDCVSLMSLHSAKGLEFPVVFLTGLEETIFPSARSLNEARGREEERRLFYVGVTRAKDLLVVSRADCRSLYGRLQYNPPSAFWHEIPEELAVPLSRAEKLFASGALASLAGSPRRRPAETSGPALADPAPYAHTQSPSHAPNTPGTHALGAHTHGAHSPTPQEEEPPMFPPGSRVRHSRLGEGEVLTVKGEGDRRKILIHFDAGLEMELLEKYGGLESAEGLPF